VARRLPLDYAKPVAGQMKGRTCFCKASIPVLRRADSLDDIEKGREAPFGISVEQVARRLVVEERTYVEARLPP
jgi:hypothetical protein